MFIHILNNYYAVKFGLKEKCLKRVGTALDPETWCVKFLFIRWGKKSMKSANSYIIHYGQNSIRQSCLVCLLEAEICMCTKMIHNNALHYYFGKRIHFFVQIYICGAHRPSVTWNVHVLSNISFIKSVDLLQQKTWVLFTLISACSNCTQPAPVLCPHCPVSIAPCVRFAMVQIMSEGQTVKPPPLPPLSLHNAKWFWKQTANLTIWFLFPIISTVFLPLQLQSLNTISITSEIETYKYELIQGKSHPDSWISIEHSCSRAQHISTCF